ncbi:toll/interleukin-1 receptor domain-containing protein [Sorangium sp. So ce426]|uniref:toll/interleukin-1 receptor domain-containing protein n=1 Tax=Sorangium sp. So ce426 TaxID=3133312 RepID=UPI003F5BD6B4
MQELDWDILLQSIKERRVVPIIGRDFFRVRDGEATVHIDRYIARQLGDYFRIQDPPDDLQQLALSILQGRDITSTKLHRGIKVVLDTVASKLEIDESLCQLAGITDFDVYVSTTFAPLIEQALSAARRGTPVKPVALNFDPYVQAISDFQPDDENSLSPIVWYVFGRVQAARAFAVTEEEMLEWLVHLHIPQRAPRNILKKLNESHLLFLGCSYPDWLARFFIRTLSGERFLERGDRSEVVDSTLQSERSLLLFLQQHGTKLVELGDPQTFVSELYRRWSSRREVAARRSDVHRPYRRDMPQDAVFLSFAGEDRVQVLEIARELTDRKFDVWLDEWQLEPGAEIDPTIRMNINSCAFFLPVLSSRALSNPEGYYYAEWKIALSRHAKHATGERFVMPVVLDEVETNHAHIPHEFKSVLWCRWSVPSEREQLIRALTDGLRRRRARRDAR